MNTSFELPGRHAPPPSDLYVVFGCDNDRQWHHRVLYANSRAQAHDWWQYMLGSAPQLVLSTEELEVGIAGLVLTASEAGVNMVWGGWLKGNAQTRFIAILADDEKEARSELRKQCQPGETVAAVVDSSPLLALIAYMRSVSAKETLPDEDLRIAV